MSLHLVEAHGLKFIQRALVARRELRPQRIITEGNDDGITGIGLAVQLLQLGRINNRTCLHLLRIVDIAVL